MAFGAEQVKNIEDIASSGGTTGCGIPHWCWEHDKGTNGSSTGSSKMSGELRQFDAVWKYYGGERFHIYLGPNHKDGTSKYFTLDTWIYFNKLATVNNIELDLNQVTLTGNTVIYGFQCDGYTNTWDYTTNAGSPENPVDQWLHSSVPCNPRNWTRNVWHHIQIAYSRDNSGNVTYKYVTLDGVQKSINETVPSAFALGWGSTLLTNFQIDGLGGYGTVNTYIDKLTISRW